MTALWLGIALLSLLAIAFVLFPVYRASQQQANVEPEIDRSSLNISIYQERLLELEQEFSAGNLDKENFDSLKLELEKNLLQDVDDTEQTSKAKLKITRQAVVIALLLALLMPVLGLAVYDKYGHSQELQQALNQPADPFNGQKPTIEEAVAELKNRLVQEPENAEGWYLLANTLMGMQDYTGAAEGYANALKYLPEEAEQYAGVNGQYAQALFFANQGQMTDQIRAEVAKTLAREEFEITALGLLGIEAYERSDYRSALEFWGKGLINASGEQADSLKAGMRSARDKLLAAGESVPDMPELAEASIQLMVNLDPSLKDKVTADQPVFIFARPVGGRMPLAAVRLTVADLPAAVTLDDSLAMSPEARLSSADKVEVIARVSTSGEPRPVAGDLSGTISSVAVQGQVDILELSIDQVVE